MSSGAGPASDAGISGGPAPRALRYLTPAEARFLDAACARLIPADDLGPGALEADVTRFIDRQLAGPYGAHARCYRHGPWAEGTPEQGWQSPLSPAQMYRAAIADLDAHCVARHRAPFALLAAQAQDTLLQALERDAVALPTVRAETFFALLWKNVQEGFFADPIHGGNRDKAGWRLIGFPGVAAADYPAAMQRLEMPYAVAPVSIDDIERGRVAVDAQGYPVRGRSNGASDRRD